MLKTYHKLDITSWTSKPSTTEELQTRTDAGSDFQTDGAAHRKERFTKLLRVNGWMSSGVAVERSVRALVDAAVDALAEILWYRRDQSLVLSTQTPYSQFCAEPAASVVDASAVWHGTASVPGGRFWLHCSAYAATSGCC